MNSYDQILSAFKRIVPLPSILHEDDAYHLNPEKLSQQIDDLGLSALMLSNPHNPTGQVIHGEELKQLVEISRKKGITLVLDEFYDQYIYQDGLDQVSAAEFVEDVNEDNIILIGGLTKGFRLPGWRVCWCIGPETLISALGQSGGFLDGGVRLSSPSPQFSKLTLILPSIHNLCIIYRPLTFFNERHFHSSTLNEFEQIVPPSNPTSCTNATTSSSASLPWGSKSRIHRTQLSTSGSI